MSSLIRRAAVAAGAAVLMVVVPLGSAAGVVAKPRPPVLAFTPSPA